MRTSFLGNARQRKTPYLISLRLPLQAGRSNVQISQITTPKE